MSPLLAELHDLTHVAREYLRAVRKARKSDSPTDRQAVAEWEQRLTRALADQPPTPEAKKP